MSVVDLATFSEKDFDCKAWVNGCAASHAHRSDAGRNPRPGGYPKGSGATKTRGQSMSGDRTPLPDGGRAC
jgi:hypothetical protein